jgi:hypothetical protein
MSTTLTANVIKKYVRRMLGEPVIEVEIEDDTIQEVIDQVLGIYGTYKPVEKVGTINVLSGQQKYTLTAAQVGKGIIEIFRPDLLRGPISLDQFDVFKYHTHLPNLDPGDYFMERVWWKEVRMSAGSDDDWLLDFNPDDGTANFYVNPIPSTAFTLKYIYVVDPTLTQVPASDDDFIKDYVLALCKIIVGEIRSKYSGVEGAESSITMNGEALKGEGQEEKRDHDDYLANRGQIIPPLRG